MNVSIYYIKDYQNFIPLAGQKNKPNSNPNKPNLVRRRRIAERVKLMQSVYLQRIMKKNAAKGYEKTKPKQTQFKPKQSQSLLKFSCAQQFVANTIYSILPNSPRQTLVAVSGVKMGLLQGWFFSISKTVFAANLYNLRLSQKLAKYQTFLKFSDHYCRYQY